MASPCAHCGDAPKVLPKNRCAECLLLRESLDVQIAAALARKSRWDGRKPAKGSESPVGTRFCSGCGSYRRYDRPGVRLDVRAGASRCRACEAVSRRTATYGLSPDQQRDLLLIQGNVCAGCRRAQRIKSLAVDHDHASGDARGYLEQECNETIGAFHDSPLRFLSLAMYLLNPPARKVGVGPAPLTKRELAEEIFKLFNQIWDETNERTE